MQQLLLLAAALAEIDNTFLELLLVPRWALKATFELVANRRGATGATTLSRMRLQQFFADEAWLMPEKTLHAFFLKAATGESMTLGEFVQVNGKGLGRAVLAMECQEHALPALTPTLDP